MNQTTTLPRSGQEKINLFETLKQKTAKIHEKVREESWAQRVCSSGCTLTGRGELLPKKPWFLSAPGNTARHLLPGWRETS